MLYQVLDATGIETAKCADLLGISPRLFDEWAFGKRPIPPSMLPLLSTVLGVPESALTSARLPHGGSEADLIPAIWFKFRGDELASDREFVLLIRKLGHHLNELEDVTGRKSVGWK